MNQCGLANQVVPYTLPCLKAQSSASVSLVVAGRSGAHTPCQAGLRRRCGSAVLAPPPW